MPRSRSSLAQRRDARELAHTPVTDPYRRQLADPYTSVSDAAFRAADAETKRAQQRPTDFVLVPEQPKPPTEARKPLRRKANPATTGRVLTPSAAGWAVFLGFVLGAVIAIFGIALITWISLQNQVGPDRSFHRGGDAADLVVGLVNLALASAYLVGSASFVGGRVAGRIILTCAGWTTLFLSAYWTQSERHVVAWLPWTMALAAVLMLMLLYSPKVSRWLGVLPVPQPE